MADKAHAVSSDPIGSGIAALSAGGAAAGTSALAGIRHRIDLLETVPISIAKHRDTWRELRELVLTGLWRQWEEGAPDRYRGYLASLTGRILAQLHHDEISAAHLDILREGSDLLGQDEPVSREAYDAYRRAWEHAGVSTLPDFSRYGRAFKHELSAR